MADQFAEVVFPVSLKKSFSYRVPVPLEGLVKPGMRCAVSFGRRQSIGLVTGLSTQTPDHVKNLKSIESLLDIEPSLTPDLIQLGQWIADYYYCSVGDALFAILPAGYRKSPKATLGLTEEGEKNPGFVEEALKQVGPLRGVNLESLKVGKIPVTARTLKLAEILKKEGLGRITLDGSFDGSRAKKTIRLGKPTAIPKLHTQQEAALTPIHKAIEEEVFKTFLLQGVTGSGKTEVYLRAIAQVLEKGKQAIVLIPEIALTPQTVERFTGRFGDKVAVLHSRLSVGERTREWQHLEMGEAQVAVGARSALFAPVKKLGLIVVDEEHESSYKQEDAPRYQARDAAVKRAQICGAAVILGSATPSLESVYNARMGKYSLLTMPERVNKRPLPKIKLVDLRQEWSIRGQDRPVLSLALEEAVRENLDRKEQSILFLNRRGFNTVTLCMKCGEQVHCPSCSIPVTSHRSSKGTILLCHYCNWQGTLPEKCPKCGDGPVNQVGLGTEKVEEELKAKFPKARIARMDLDTTRKQGSHEELLDRFRRGEVDLLVGTQMVAKGHDFPGVTLVGIVGADTGLALPDFRSAERVFQLLVQVAGRAGRAEKEGAIYLQTFHPEHPSIQAAVKHDTEEFWKGELELRKALGYPPFSKLGLLVYRNKDEKKAHKVAEEAAVFLKREASSLKVQVSGPATAGIFKLRDEYRFQILLKAEKPQFIRQLIQRLDARIEIPSGVIRVVDLDPQSML
jgi:primosomal protein N' (replication factor Y) (superfamily II helicase)